MRYPQKGVTPVLENTQTNKTHFENLLKEKILSKPSTFLGHESNGSAVFFAILNAAHLLPPNSGIVIFMKRDTYTEDESLAHLAFLELKKKLIQVVKTVLKNPILY